MAETTDHTKPFIVDKNLGAALDIENAQLTETTSDGTPVVPPTQGTEVSLLTCGVGS